ncbi:hypothetical protein GCM10023219_08690 [Stakelama sediminis]
MKADPPPASSRNRRSRLRRPLRRLPLYPHRPRPLHKRLLWRNRPAAGTIATMASVRGIARYSVASVCLRDG